jgi:KDO2-lipid IV(A) lauroyltransferase
MSAPLLRRARWRFEAAIVGALFALCRALGPVRASNLGAAIARLIGPWLPVSRVAEVNLAIAFPDRDAAFRRATIRAMWENLGRVGGELPNLPAIMARQGEPDRALAEGPGWAAEGDRHLAPLRAAGGPGILVSGHFGNWEAMPGAAARRGVGFALIYRAIGNPYLDAMIHRLRASVLGTGDLPLLPKGAVAARGALGHLRAGGFLGLLGDQKMNDGIAAPLFGREAMTAPAAAQLALRLRCPLVMGRAVREGPARFRVVIDPPLARPDTGTTHGDIAALAAAMNATFERWARERPAEWLWVHRRFDKALYRRTEQ